MATIKEIPTATATATASETPTATATANETATAMAISIIKTSPTVVFGLPTVMQRAVAVKIVRIPDRDEQTKLRLEEQFNSEVALLTRLYHPNIVQGPPRFEGDRPRFGDRDGYRGGPRGGPGDFGGDKSGAPPEFQPSFRDDTLNSRNWKNSHLSELKHPGHRLLKCLLKAGSRSKSLISYPRIK